MKVYRADVKLQYVIHVQDHDHLDPVYTGADRDRIQNYPDSFGSDPFLP